MFSPNPAPIEAERTGHGRRSGYTPTRTAYTRARTPQGGMSPTALGALFPPVTTTEGLTAAEAGSQRYKIRLL
jgi:hypothetical protein